MSEQNNSETDLNHTPGALARAEAVPLHGAGASGAAPGVVIPGERLSESSIPEGGERFEMYLKGKHLVIEAHPIPTLSVPGFAAITDCLNCSFPFEADTINLPNFFTDFAEVASK